MITEEQWRRFVAKLTHRRVCLDLDSFTEADFEAIISTIDERVAQNKKWGGPSHDDEHGDRDWLDFIEHQIEHADSDLVGEEDRLAMYAKRYEKIAALALAGYASIKRQYLV